MNIKTANRLLELRKKNGLSQEALAEKLGISRQSISKWERAESSPDTDNLIALAKLYGVTLDELLMPEEKSEETASPVDDQPQNSESDGSQSDDGNPSEGSASILDDEEKYAQYVDEGFNFIKVDADNGDKVRIGTRGVYVQSADGDNVKVGLKGIRVNGSDVDPDDIKKNGHIYVDEQKSVSKVHRAFRHFPYPIFAVVAFFVLGFWASAWSWCWLVFLTVPLYYTTVEAIAKRKPSIFCYPVLALVVFFVLGFFVPGAWVWCWLLFLTIPFYYAITHAVEKR